VDTPPNAPTPDVELQPTSDYGSLGPGSDIKVDQNPGVKLGEGPKVDVRPGFSFKLGLPTSVQSQTPPVQLKARRAAQFLAIVAGAMIAFGLVITKPMTHTRRAENEFQTTRTSGTTGTRPRSQRFDSATQKQAEQLLTAVARNDANAIAQVDTLSPSWHGRIRFTPQLTNLITAGLNARDLPARAATVRVDLAAMNVAEDSSSVERLATQAESPDHATRIWAIWTLGLLANRSIETEHIVTMLTAHLSDSDVESRHWAVEALSYTGSDASIPPLLKAIHDDPSPLVRERAACGLAESGMLTNDQRRTTIPTLLTYADDPALDAATHSWAYHALRDISGQNLPDNSAAWRKWYESANQN
jgi:hypothetical protein